MRFEIEFEILVSLIGNSRTNFFSFSIEIHLFTKNFTSIRYMFVYVYYSETNANYFIISNIIKLLDRNVYTKYYQSFVLFSFLSLSHEIIWLFNGCLYYSIRKLKVLYLDLRSIVFFLWEDGETFFTVLLLLFISIYRILYIFYSICY